MAFVFYTQIKELRIQEKEIYEFGNWLMGISDNNGWNDEYEDENEEEIDIPLNADGNVMEYPWDDFSYVVVPDSEDDVKSAIRVCESLGATSRYDIYDLDRIFFVIK